MNSSTLDRYSGVNALSKVTCPAAVRVHMIVLMKESELSR
jgi:hypothetical protein